MIWLLRDFDLLAVVLRAAVLAFEALTFGGVAFLLIVAPVGHVRNTSRRLIACASSALLVSSAISAAIITATLMSTSGLGVLSFVGANYFLAGLAMCSGALLILFCLRLQSLVRAAWPMYAMPFCAALIVAGSITDSHAASRIDHRWPLLAFTAAHHVGMALWVGAMPFLLASLRQAQDGEAKRLVSRYSSMAVAGAALLIAAGLGLAWFYLGFFKAANNGGYGSGGASAIYGTAYGAMLLAKTYLLVLMLSLGYANSLIARRINHEPQRLITRLRSFSEVEIVLGFTAIIAAASLTSQPPAIDLVQNRLSLHEIAMRFRPAIPSMRSPKVAALTSPASMEIAVRENAYRGTSVSDAEDRAWSEYNHHWAGLIVLLVGGLALLSRQARMRWARHWPLAFAGLALFILIRADPENWPLGPRPFWGSFSQPDVLQHRIYAALLLGFAWFEWSVQTDRWRGRFGARTLPFAFPAMCAVGAGLLLLHSHALGNIKEELLSEMSHNSIALLGATAGCARWLELRLPHGGEQSVGRPGQVAAYTWPTCLMLAGLLLMDYRET